MSAAALILVWNLATSFFRGKVAGDNPWNAWTLEWATTSPPPHENFVALPPIRSRRPLWDLANPDRPDPIVGENSAAVTLPDHNKVGILGFIFSEAGFFGGAYPCLFVFLRSATSRSRTERAGCSANTGVQRLSFREQLHFLAIRGRPDETASRFHAWLARADDSARRYLPCWSGNGVLETVSDRGRSQHQSVLDYVFHSNWLPWFARPPWFDRAADFSLGWRGRAISLLAAVDSAFKSVGYYWHFVDVVWVFVLLTVYILPLIR